MSIPRKDRGYVFPAGQSTAAAAASDRQRGVALTRLLLDDKRDVAVMLGLLPEAGDPGWELGPVVEGGLRRLGVVA